MVEPVGVAAWGVPEWRGETVGMVGWVDEGARGLGTGVMAEGCTTKHTWSVKIRCTWLIAPSPEIQPESEGPAGTVGMEGLQVTRAAARRMVPQASMEREETVTEGRWVD